MTDERLIRVTVSKLMEEMEERAEVGPEDLSKCRACRRRPANGLDGMCVPCSRKRERLGNWETIPLEEQQ